MQINSTSSHTSFFAATAALDDEPIADDLPADTSEEQVAAFNAVSLEAEILAVFEQPPLDGEPRELAFKRKEHQLGSLFGQLVPAESLALEQRLRLAQPGDPIAAQFKRFISARQARLLSFLAHSRKRHPLQYRHVAAVGH
jgi:hypothetical protein